ncbi:hypothetical protein SEVIR_7G196500v4 [Setaria viridis]|uniref:H15 domain-containing protein n=1 Tax=Setaria viridis TaxID=4556 RepID=A0A4U6TVY9_SETVI|nr:uncharacterized protein LOC117864128 [Setaria viridis]TKW05744.1 hypothetical protein SEVIR_7G196500v2 [Setaria viridis]
MVDGVEVDAGQAAKRSKATDEEGKTPPPVGAVRKQRQPTPDHPPYCWMIGEAIDALGGSEEDSISAFIRARHPGVPAAHDRLLRHYLDKHVAEGFFMCTAAGLYLRSPDENTAEELPVEPAAAGSSEEAKRGRGRPRKDGSASMSPAGKKDGARSATPKPRGRRRATAGLATDEGCVPTSPVSVANKDGSQAASSTPKRRGQRRAVAPQSATEDSVPASLVAVADKKDGSQAAFSTPKRRGQRRAVAPQSATEDSVPASPVDVADKKDGTGSQAVSSTPKRRGRLRKLGMTTTTDSYGKTLVEGKKGGCEAPDTTIQEHEPRRELAQVIVGDGPATTSIMDKASAEVPPTTPVEGRQPLELALVNTTDVPVPAPTPAMDKDSRDAPSFNLALVAKNDSICATSFAPESSSQACELALVVADDGPVPVLVADKKDGVGEAPPTNKRVRQPRKVGSAPTAGEKAGSKALPDTPKGRRQQCKPAVVAPDGSALTPVAGKKKASPKLARVTAGGCSTPASVAKKDGIEARELYPLTADEIPDDPSCCLLALPCLTTAAANA